jgi:hypothetical protein
VLQIYATDQLLITAYLMLQVKVYLLAGNIVRQLEYVHLHVNLGMHGIEQMRV